MSASKLTPLVFAMSFEDLIATSIEKEAFLRRDVTDLIPRGVTVARLDAFATIRTAFMAIPSASAEIHTATLGYEARNAQTTVLLEAIEQVIGIAATTFGKKSAQYKGFDIKGLSKLSAEALCTQSTNVVLKGTLNQTAMAANGLTPAMLTNITTQATALMPLIAATPTLEDNSEETTVVRRTTANSLYTEMKKMCQIATVFYTRKNKLKVEDYVIYPHPTVLKRNGIVKTNSLTSRKADTLIATTQIKLKVSEGTGLEFYFGLTTKSLPGLKSITVNYNPNIYTTTTAEDLGFNAATGMIHFIIRNINPDTAKFIAKIGGKD